MCLQIKMIITYKTIISCVLLLIYFMDNVSIIFGLSANEPSPEDALS